MERPTIPGRKKVLLFDISCSFLKKGYTLLLLLFLIFILSLSLLIAVPVWETQLQREKEEELIFRGRQYVEAIRLFQQKYPGTFPRQLDELLEKKCIRRLYPDPMSESGEWNLILIPPSPISGGRSAGPFSTPDSGGEEPARRRPGGISFQKILVVPAALLSQVDNPQIIGVVSSSPQKSIKIYNQQDHYDHWFFYYGQTPGQTPKVVYFGEESKKK